MNQMARETARQQRQAEVQHRREMRQLAAEQRAAIRNQRIAEKEEKQRYLESRQEEAKEANIEIEDRIKELGNVLHDTLLVNDAISFDSLKRMDPYEKFSPRPELIERIPMPIKDSFRPSKRNPGILGKLFPRLKKAYENSVRNALTAFQNATEFHQQKVKQQQKAYQEAYQNYQDKKLIHDQIIASHNKSIDEFREAYVGGDPNAICGYYGMVLERSDYPEGFPQSFKIAYVPESKQLVVDYDLPGPEIIPSDSEYRYVKASDQIQKKSRKPAELQEMYQDLVAAVALRTCHELFESDQVDQLDSVVFNGFVQTVDMATGRDIRPCLISVRATKTQFQGIDLARVDKKVCLRSLGAQVSPRPYETQPVKPIVEFSMVDRRFVDQHDMISELDARPNLMDLNPFEFEHLVGNLFKKHGLETKLTRSSRDGGVDVVAFDLRPVLGGKVVIQAKRYRNTVGVSAVRDLFGTMMNEGANKGILVTTSGYGPDAFEFAKGKPIELIDGGQLLYLLEQCGTKARIIFPPE
jgi:restriction system protein